MAKRTFFQRLRVAIRVFLRTAGASVLAALAAIVIAGWFVFRSLLTPDTLAPLLAGELRNVLHRSTRIESARVVPLQGIRVSGVTIDERPGFGGVPFVTCRLMIAKPDWGELLHGRLVLEELRFYSPEIRFVRVQTEEGPRWNVGDFGAGGRGAPAAFHQFEIQDGLVSVFDQKSGSRQELSGADFLLSVSSPNAPMPFSLRLGLRHERDGKSLEGRIEADGNIAGFGSRDTLRVEVSQAQARLPGLTLWANGSFSNPGAPAIDLSWRSSVLRKGDLTAMLPALEKLDLPAASGELRMTVGGGRVEASTLTATVGPIQLQGSGSFDVTAATPTIAVDLKTNRFPVAAAAAIWKPLLDYALAGDVEASVQATGPLGDVSLDRFRLASARGGGSWKDLKVAGATLDFATEPPHEKATLKVAGARLEHEGQLLEDLHGSAKLGGGELRIEQLATNWNGHPLNARARILQPFAPKRVVVDGRIEVFQLDQLIEWVTNTVRRGSKEPPDPNRWARLGWLRLFRKALPGEFPQLQGDVQSVRLDHPNIVGKEFRVSFDLDGLTKGMSSLKGAVIVDVRDGKVIDIPALEKNDFLRYVFLPFATVKQMRHMGYLESKSLETLEFDRIHGNYRFKDGSMLMDNFFVQGKELTATAEGEIDWPNERLLLHVVCRVNKAGMGAPETLSDEKGRPTLSFFIEGPMLSPEIRVDLQKIKVGEIERFMDAGLAEGAARIERLKREMW